MTTNLIDERIDALRAETPGCAHVVHFNHAGSSLSPQPVLDAVFNHLTLEAQIGGYEAHDVALDQLNAVYDSVARLINAKSEEIALVENATRGWDMAAYAIPYEAGDRVLVSQAEYPSNYISILQLAKTKGLKVEIVPNDADGQMSLDGLREALRQPVKALFVSHMPTNGGLVQPAADIGVVLREVQPDAWYVLDACQTAGQLPLDVEAIQCDVLSTTSRKYLRGPRGAGFVYARAERIPLMEPPLLDIKAAEMTSPTTYKIREDARRFENWESYFAGRLGLGVAVDYALDLGLDAIWERVERQARTLRTRLGEVDGVKVLDQGKVLGGIVTWSKAGASAPEVKAALAKERINVSLSNNYPGFIDLKHDALGVYVRSSVHYLTTDEEIERLVGVVRTI